MRDRVIDKLFAELTTLQLENISLHEILDRCDIPRKSLNGKGKLTYTLYGRLGILESKLSGKLKMLEYTKV